MKENKVELEEAEAANIEELKDSKINVAIDQEGQLWLDGKEIIVEDLQSRITVLLAGAKEKVVTLTVDKNLTHQNFGKVFMELSKAGAEIALVGKLLKE